jgi:hypothetical protein
MPDIEPGTWTRQDNGSYRNADGWTITMVAAHCWRITRPNGFHADLFVYPTAEQAQARVPRYARLQIVAS